MPQNKDLKRLVRARMAETGEHYTQALAHLQGLAELEPLPAPWHITGSQAPDYEERQQRQQRAPPAGGERRQIHGAATFTAMPSCNSYAP